MTCPSRRVFLTGAAGLALLAALGGCADDPTAPEDPPGLHPALRRPRRAGAVAFLRGGGNTREALLSLRGEPGVLVGLGPALAPGLSAMPPFPGEVLLPERANPDAFLQVEGDDDCSARLDALLARVPAEVAWRTAVSRDTVDQAPSLPLQRNPFGFVEGQTNTPDVLLPDGSSLLAVRVIRLAHPLWDADTPEVRTRVIGRHPDGTWLDGTAPTGTPDFAADPDGATTALDSHVRTMNPRTPGTAAPVMLRRSWVHEGGGDDRGVVFMAFQKDFTTGFARAQQRLTADALHPYLLAVGGGYFSVPA
ncbi:Dyp-type peroxidase domain-containing protein [Umezawaea sp. Da 62-37]|uniref:Dyp-type peroxidase n=1 Tax=Umezawaea sp. Da 62-37 TaxID=3075927 RepID=UPI0028F73B71|nr:Dyp-type peroxidase domain-containing protein [Umezawaea sp. Da 62-37]WNV87865.1 Dyp-type peroxidase [Umezawaea sp. Da 62-37]